MFILTESTFYSFNVFRRKLYFIISLTEEWKSFFLVNQKLFTFAVQLVYFF